MMMEKHDLGALVCFVGENVRYITSVFQGNWKNNIYIRYCVLPRDGEPVLFETAGSDLECAKIDAPWLKGNIRPAITWKWAETAESFMADKMAHSVLDVLKENGVENEKIGLDVYDPSAYEAFKKLDLNIVSAWPAMSGARIVKTPDEIECLKISSAIGDTSFWKIEHEWLKPGVKESEITAKVNEYLYTQGFDFVYDIIVASGGNTSPYRRWHTDKVIREGDLVIVDQNAVGPGGYFVDFVRCFKVGGRWTQKEKDLYKECYESMYAAIEMMKAGNTTADVAEKLPTYADDEFGTVTLQQFAHSIGLSLYEGMWISRAYTLDYPGRAARRACTSRPRRSPATPASSRRCAWRRTCSSPRTGRSSSPSTRSTTTPWRDTVLVTDHVFGDLEARARRARPRSTAASRSHPTPSPRRWPPWRPTPTPLLVCFAQVDRAGHRGGGRRLQGHRPLRDRGRQRRRGGGDARRHPGHQRARLLPRRGRRPRDGAAAGVGARRGRGRARRARGRLDGAAGGHPPDRGTPAGADRRRADRPHASPTARARSATRSSATTRTSRTDRHRRPAASRRRCPRPTSSRSTLRSPTRRGT